MTSHGHASKIFRFSTGYEEKFRLSLGRLSALRSNWFDRFKALRFLKKEWRPRSYGILHEASSERSEKTTRSISHFFDAKNMQQKAIHVNPTVSLIYIEVK